ncbi:hypothetical protein D8L93_08280 [Sodalis-like symbiont of Bactericera trigonica]|nr:hypothetical protein D8L93_08280 [Sodalis-like symbiont of Bactericera trigonica]
MGKISAALARLQPEFPDVKLTSGLAPAQFVLVEQLAAANVYFIINGMAMDFFQPGVAGEMGKAAKDAVVNIAAQHGLSSLLLWSLNRDNPSSLDYVHSESSSNPEQRVTGEYTRSFLAGALNVPLPTLPDNVQVVDAQMKPQPVDITSSTHWRAKEIEAAVASALPLHTRHGGTGMQHRSLSRAVRRRD